MLLFVASAVVFFALTTLHFPILSLCQPLVCLKQGPHTKVESSISNLSFLSIPSAGCSFYCSHNIMIITYTTSITVHVGAGQQRSAAREM